MNKKKLWIYLAVLSVVCGLWGGAELFFPKKTEEEKNPPLFTKLNPSKITEIQWQRSSEVIHLKKQPTWSIIRPISVPADGKAVDRLIESLSTLRPGQRFSVGKQGLSEFGLNDPKLKILFLIDGKWIELQIGDKNTVGNAYFGKVAASPEIFLLEDYILKDLDRDLYFLRDKRVFSFDLKQIQSLEIKADKTVFVVEKDAKGWSSRDLPGKRLKADFVETFISDLLWLQAKGFGDSGNKERKAGLKTSSIQLKLISQGKEAKEETLALGKEEPGKGYWAKSPLHQDVVLIEPNIVKKIPKGPQEWEDTTPPPSEKKGP